MTSMNLPARLLDLPVPAEPAPAPLAAIVAASGEVFTGLHLDRTYLLTSTLRSNIARAEAFLANCTTKSAMLREAMEPMLVKEIGDQVEQLVSAWPNTSSNDLRLYGAHLANDVIDRYPCRYAVRDALRHLRQTSKFLPSIAEVLTALDEAQRRILNTSWHIRQIPIELAKARATLAILEQREARREGCQS